MARYEVRTNRAAGAAFPFLVAGGCRPQYFKTYSDAVQWVACIEALERDIARLVRLWALRGAA
jgi:hypothetical protein